MKIHVANQFGHLATVQHLPINGAAFMKQRSSVCKQIEEHFLSRCDILDNCKSPQL